MKKKRGIILICTLVIMIILSIFLMTAVYQMQSSTMVTKKVMWDIKSYWSALAGSTIATDGCLRNYSWPQQGLLEQAGGYIITTDISNNKILVTAEDNVSGSKVTIYHKSKLLNNTGHESPAPPEEILNDHFTNMQLNTSTSDEEQGEIYCLSVGKSGPTVIGLELVYGLYYNPNLFGQAIGNHAITQNEMRREASISAAGAIYVQGDLTANLKNSFKIAQKNGTRGYIVVGGNVDIKNKEGQNCPPNPDGAGPVQLAEGAIFMGGNETKENRICKINGIKIEPDNNSNITDYGIAVYTSPKIVVAEPTLNELVTPIPLPAGMFCFVEMPNEYDKDEFNGTIDALLKVCLTFEEFYDIYGESFKGVKENTTFEKYHETLTSSSFSNSDMEKFNKKFNELFEEQEKNIKSKIVKSEIANSGLIQYLLSGGVQALEENLTEIKNLYQCYLLEQCKNVLSAYKSSEGNRYASFFIPNGNAGIEENNEKITLEYETFAKARALGEVASKIKRNSTGTYNVSLSGFIQYMSLVEGVKDFSDKTSEEYKAVKQHFAENRENFDYIAEEVNLGTNKKCFVLNKFSEYVDEVINSSSNKTKFTAKAQEIATALEHVTFESDNSHLIMGIGCHVQSDSSFKFATFERKDKYLGTNVQQINSDSNPKTTSSLYVPKTDYIAKQSMPVEIMTEFLKLFTTPVMARMQAVQVEMYDGGGGGGGYSGGYSHPVQLEAPSPEVIDELIHENDASDYISAINRRAAIRLGEIIEKNDNGNTTYYLTTDNSITAKNINIKGFIYGTGHIASTQGDIKFEAVGSGVDATEENWVSIWSKNDIIINRVSATKSSESGEDAELSSSDFRGILYSKNDLTVDVGNDNLDFAVSGAIICGNNMNMIGIRNLKVNYDPSLSSLILSKYVANWDTGSTYIKSTLEANTNKKEEYINTGKFKMFNRI